MNLGNFEYVCCPYALVEEKYPIGKYIGVDQIEIAMERPNIFFSSLKNLSNSEWKRYVVAFDERHIDIFKSKIAAAISQGSPSHVDESRHAEFAARFGKRRCK